MAERPEAFVGKPGVVAALLRAIQPDPSKPVRRCCRWNPHTITAIDDGLVRGSRAVGDPRAEAGPHDRLQRGHQATARPAHDDPLTGHPVVTERLPICEHDHRLSRERRRQGGAQAFRRPRWMRTTSRRARMSRMGFHTRSRQQRRGRDHPASRGAGPNRSGTGLLGDTFASDALAVTPSERAHHLTRGINPRPSQIIDGHSPVSGGVQPTPC